jgi:hypothetical protein
MKNLIITLTAFTFFATISSCKKEDDDHHAGGTQNSDYINAADCTGSSPTYTADVAPITETICATSGCHNAATASHGLDLEGYDAVKNNFNDHNLLCAINHANGCDPMPKGLPKLSDAQIKTITCWAKNNFPL